MSLNELERANLPLKETYNYMNGIIENTYKPWIAWMFRVFPLWGQHAWPYYIDLIMPSFHSCTISIYYTYMVFINGKSQMVWSNDSQYTKMVNKKGQFVISIFIFPNRWDTTLINTS